MNMYEALSWVWGIQGEGLFIFRRIWRESITFWDFRELGRKVIFSFREQGAKTPPPGGGTSCIFETLT